MVRCGARRVAFGTAVGRRQLVTKASQLTEGELRIETRDGGRLPARVLATDYDSDLALLSVEDEVLQPLKRSQSKVGVGDWLAVPGLDDVPIAVGVLSVKAHPRRSRGRGHLAIEFEAGQRNAKVKRVPRGLVQGLQAGDVIERVGSREVSGPRSFSRAIRRRRPGRNITLTVRRGQRLVELTAKVRSDRAPRQPAGSASGGHSARSARASPRFSSTTSSSRRASAAGRSSISTATSPASTLRALVGSRRSR